MGLNKKNLLKISRVCVCVLFKTTQFQMAATANQLNTQKWIQPCLFNTFWANI